MKKKLLAFVLAAVIAVSPTQSVFAENYGAAEETTDASQDTSSRPSQPEVEPGWVKMNKAYRWRQADGTYLQAAGWVTLEGKVYYLKEDGTRYSGLLKLKGKYYDFSPSLTYGLKEIKGNVYYFDKTTGAARTGWQMVKKKNRYFLKNGVMARNRWVKVDGKYYYIKKNGASAAANKWLTLKGKQYYISKKGYRLTGLVTIKRKKYYFGKDGVLVKDRSGFRINGKYYEIDSNGVAVRTSALKAECNRKARAFVAKHTTPGMSNAQKFRACFNYIMAYTNFKPWINPTDAEFKTSIWPYQSAIYMFDNGLSGSCYGVASTVAACASVLGYEPYVIATTGDHGFVMIDGLYYDNMGPLFGASTHFAYTTRSKVKF